MKKTLFIKTETGKVVVPKLVNSNWLGRWAFDSWLKRYFKKDIQKSSEKAWNVLTEIYEVKTLIEEDKNYRVENSETNNKE